MLNKLRRNSLGIALRSNQPELVGRLLVVIDNLKDNWLRVRLMQLGSHCNVDWAKDDFVIPREHFLFINKRL